VAIGDVDAVAADETVRQIQTEGGGVFVLVGGYLPGSARLVPSAGVFSHHQRDEAPAGRCGPGSAGTTLSRASTGSCRRPTTGA
jgi:hypothetical protein